MFQSRLDEDRRIFNLLTKLYEKEGKTDADEQEIRRLNVIYYVDNSDVRNYYVQCKPPAA